MVLRRPDELGAEVDDLAAGDRPVEHPPADAVARLEHRDRVPGARDLARRDEPGQPGADDDDVLRGDARGGAARARRSPAGARPRPRRRPPRAAPATKRRRLTRPGRRSRLHDHRTTRAAVKRDAFTEFPRDGGRARPIPWTLSDGRARRATTSRAPSFPSPRSRVEWLATMMLIRRFEERAGEMYAKAKVGGFLHLAIGEEATIVGSTRALRDQDYLISTYRSHGHALARGSDPDRVMAELFGRVDGLCKGRGGSMHMFDLEKRFMGGYGIVGGNLPLAAGFALASDYLGRDEATLCQFGDGASNQGTFGETMNLAALWKLPVVFMITNNQFGMGTALERHSAMTDLLRKGEGFGVPGMRCDGMDVRRHLHRHDRGAADRARGAPAGPRRGAHLPLPRALDGRPRGVPHEGAGRRVAQARPARRLRRPARRGRGSSSADEREQMDARRRSSASTTPSRSPTPRRTPSPNDALRRHLRARRPGARLVLRRRAHADAAPRRGRARRWTAPTCPARPSTSARGAATTARRSPPTTRSGTSD